MESTSIPSAKPSVSRSAIRLLRVALVTVIALACLVAVGSAALFYYIFAVRDNISFDLKPSSAIAAQVVTGAMKPDAYGVVKLPASAGKLSLNGEIYATMDSSGITWVLFRTWQGKGSNLHGYLYRSTPATGPVPPTITVRGPTVQYSATDPPTDSIDYSVDRQLNSNWYEVRFDMN
jgi:hypothetical protein